MSNLIPNYLEIDYATLKERLKDLMKNSDTFKDYNYEGANITMLIELVSYLSELQTYYSNKISKNVYPGTADLFQTVHSIAAGIQGYYPHGYIAPSVTVNVTVSLDNVNPGDQLYIPAWYPINTELTTDDDEEIIYTTTQAFTETVPTDASGSHTFEITMKQGTSTSLSYSPDDIINNRITLSFFNFDNDIEPYDTNPALSLYVNGTPWERVGNFISDISNVSGTENYYELEYDKYKRYNIKFSDVYIEPSDNDKIEIIILRTLGTDGDIAGSVFSDFNNTEDIYYLNDDEIDTQESYFIQNLTQDTYVEKDDISITNPEASINSSNPETITDVKQGGLNNSTTQYRTVIKSDFESYLEEHDSISTAYAWGEKEENSGNTLEYNKVYISVIPSRWSSSTISIRAHNWVTETEGISASVYSAQQYNDSLKSSILTHLSSRKFLNVYESFILPELVWFAFDIGLRVKRIYNFTSVKEDVKEKLTYYFSYSNRSFNEIIDFKELHNFLLDENEVSPTNNFTQVKGIRNLVFRDILTYVPSKSSNKDTIYENNTNGNYPMFTVSEYDTDYENILRPIQLGLKQFPMLALNNCSFLNEE